MVFFSDVSDGQLYRMDTISYQGKMWLVPSWLDNAQKGWRIPERIIWLDVLPHQATPGGPTDFVLSAGIPKAVCDGQIPQQPEGLFLVIERPDIRFPAIGG